MSPFTDVIRGALEQTPIQRRAFALRRTEILDDGLVGLSEGAIVSIQDGLAYQAKLRLELYEALTDVLEDRRRASDI